MSNNPIIGYLISAVSAILIAVYVQQKTQRLKQDQDALEERNRSTAAGVDLAKIEKEAYRRAEASNELALKTERDRSTRLEARVADLENRLNITEERARAAEERARAAEQQIRQIVAKESSP